MSPSHRSGTLRLLIVNSTLHVGGAERIAACLAEHLDRNRFEVTACYLKEPGIVADQMMHAGVDLIPIPGLIPGKRDYFSSIKLWKLIQARGIHIVHSHDLHGLMDVSACRTFAPNLRHVHTFHFGNYPHREPRYRMIERSLWRVPDALVAVGKAQSESICALYRIPPNRIRVIWNGIDPPRALHESQPLAQVRGRGQPVIASISTLIPQKGLIHLLDAASLLRESGDQFQLVIAGDGNLKLSLIEYARAKGLSDCVHFLGWIPQASDRLLYDCDVFVQSSLWEAMSVVVLEAMAAGKAMVVTRVGENGEVVTDGETGILAPPADAVALAHGLRTLLRSSGLRDRLGAAARKRYDENFSANHMISAYAELYQELGANQLAKQRQRGKGRTFDGT